MGNPVDITGGEPPITYVNTVNLGLEDPRIHAPILEEEDTHRERRWCSAKVKAVEIKNG